MSGPPVLLLHGFATSCARTWGENGWLDLIAEGGREVVGVDLLGHGEADKPHDPEAYDRTEELVVAQLPDGQVDAIGFSLGARTLLAIASEHPERFRRIVVAGVGANLFRRDEDRGRAIQAAVGGAGDVTDREAAYFGQLAESPEVDRDALLACMRRPNPPAITAEGLARITQPVLVVLGDQDFAGPPDPLLEKLPDATLKVLRRVDHFGTPKDFGFIDAALQFLEIAP